jgi:hypothetical protein
LVGASGFLKIRSRLGENSDIFFLAKSCLFGGAPMAYRFADCDGVLTEFGGLMCFRDLWRGLGMHLKINELLPNPRKSKSILRRQQQKFEGLLFGFLCEADCLDDMNHLNKDQGFLAATNSQGFGARIYGSFLRQFNDWQVRQLNELLMKMAFEVRLKLFPNDRDFILDIDSTTHEQYGRKMEGCNYNYDNIWGLDSIQAYDQYGLQYWMQLREGATFTANSAPTIIAKVFSGKPRSMNRFLRADSGYCNHDVFRECADHNVGFVIAGRANMYDPLSSRVRNWRPAKDLTFFDGRKCDIGTTFYYQAQGRETIRVVLLRARKKQPDLFDKDPYDYRAWFTNTGDHEFSWEEVIGFYNGRGNSENLIRELKNGFDIHHFPCLSLRANKIYGLIAAFAYNLMRMASLTYTKSKFHFSKKIRQRLIRIAALVVKKSRYLIIRMNNHRRKEVEDWFTRIKYQLTG